MTADRETAKTLNILARQQLKTKMMADILMDIHIRELESWDWREYVEDLRNELDRILKKHKRKDKRQQVLF